MKTIREVILEYLKSVGADGIYDGGECGYDIDDLDLASENSGLLDAVPAKKIETPEDSEWYGETDYLYQAMKDTAK